MAFDNFNLNNVSLTRDDHSILAGVSLTFHSKKLIGIIGANGVGKSSLLMLLAGLLEPTHGEVMYGEKPLCSFSRQQMARLIGISFQQSLGIFDLTVYEALLMASFTPTMSNKENNKNILGNCRKISFAR